MGMTEIEKTRRALAVAALEYAAELWGAGSELEPREVTMAAQVILRHDGPAHAQDVAIKGMAVTLKAAIDFWGCQPARLDLVDMGKVCKDCAAFLRGLDQ